MRVLGKYLALMAMVVMLVAPLAGCAASPEYQEYKRDVLWNDPWVAPATYTGGILGFMLGTMFVWPAAAPMDFFDHNEIVRNEEETRAYKAIYWSRYTGGEILGTPVFWIRELVRSTRWGSGDDDDSSEGDAGSDE